MFLNFFFLTKEEKKNFQNFSEGEKKSEKSGKTDKISTFPNPEFPSKH